jgi:LCP family protein required for cell wall assembly
VLATATARVGCRAPSLDGGSFLALSTSSRALVAILVVAIVGVVAAVTLLPTSGAPLVPSVTTSSPLTAQTHPYPLEVRLRRVLGRGPDGPVRRRALRRPAEAIRGTFTDLYETAFVDPELWGKGRFPGLERFFAADARAQARRDLGELTIGRSARRLEAVRPRPARLEVRFVTDGGGHAVVAFADMHFRATATTAAADRIRVAQHGRFVLRRTHGAWRIDSYDVRGRIPSAAGGGARPRAARFVPGPPTSDPLFVLVIGSDARPHQVATRTRADSLHIVGVNPRVARGAIVGIPRDSYVPIPGHGTAKINASLSYGGPELVVRTVEALTGVHVDAYVLTGFDGFHRLVDAIGGLDVHVPYPMNDPNSGAHFRPGPTHLNGREALAFSRDRHDAPGGDLGRSMNQGRVLVATLRQLRAVVAKDPARLLPWLVAATRFLRTDLSLSQMMELLLAASTFEPGRIRTTVVFGSGGTANGESVVRLGGSAYSVFRDLARNGVLGR